MCAENKFRDLLIFQSYIWIAQFLMKLSLLLKGVLHPKKDDVWKHAVSMS
jgi:hypothetical protein